MKKEQKHIPCFWISYLSSMKIRGEGVFGLSNLEFLNFLKFINWIFFNFFKFSPILGIVVELFQHFNPFFQRFCQKFNNFCTILINFLYFIGNLKIFTPHGWLFCQLLCWIDAIYNKSEYFFAFSNNFTTVYKTFLDFQVISKIFWAYSTIFFSYNLNPFEFQFYFSKFS